MITIEKIIKIMIMMRKRLFIYTSIIITILLISDSIILQRLILEISNIIIEFFVFPITFGILGSSLFSISKLKDFRNIKLSSVFIKILKIVYSGIIGGIILSSLIISEENILLIASYSIFGGFLGRFFLEILSFIEIPKLTSELNNKNNLSLLYFQNLLSLGIIVGFIISILGQIFSWYLLLIIVLCTLLIVVLIGYLQLRYSNNIEENDILRVTLSYIDKKNKEIQSLINEKNLMEKSEEEEKIKIMKKKLDIINKKR